ncbi:MAG: ubiquinone/menaquinone biosynthesis methyltransferase [Chloroflexi bacterium]|nr:ubiquinone/menaquinone biosynthesis methyltransferase [Chloroflexota bacterium]
MARLQGQEKARYVAAMFARVARRYDFMNTIITAGMHGRWRRLAARLGAEGVAPGPALDVATGTGDLAFALGGRREVQRVVGLDFVPEMLVLARAKADHRSGQAAVAWVRGDALALPFPDNTFMCATSGFSMRNVQDVRHALAEMVRVVRPQGRVAVLEITPITRRSLPSSLLRFYFRRVVPLLGQGLAGNREAYTYLPSSVEAFPPAKEFARLMEEVGLQQVRYRRVGLGMVALHVGTKR